MPRLSSLLIVLASCASAFAATRRVPQDNQTLQAAIDAAQAGDTILVGPGTYRERIRLKPGITLRSVGDNAIGEETLKRTESTIIDGGGDASDSPGVTMAENCTLDGFTITNIGIYDEAVWQRHYQTHGEDLRDDEGSVQAEGTVPAIRIQGVSCTVAHCRVHHNGDVGIAIIGQDGLSANALIHNNLSYRNLGGGIGIAAGAAPIVRNNVCRENLRAGIGCRQANPVIVGNECYHNVRAGIGCREGARPVIRDNKCYQNRRAGIGIRMAGTAPVVENNQCDENEMAGIGCRDGASPTLRNNVCRRNKMAGIGSRNGARPLIIHNQCRENKMAGIGIQAEASALIQSNVCLDNQLVAIGVIGKSNATIIDNELSRSGGMPPLIAVRDDSNATIQANRFKGGGVAALLVQGQATICKNDFVGNGAKQGNAIWVWEDSTVSIINNSFHGYRTSVDARKAVVTVLTNTIKQFQGAAIVVKSSQAPAHISANTALSADPNARVVDVDGPTGVMEGNVLTRSDDN